MPGSTEWMQSDDPNYPKTKAEYGVYHQKSINGPWELVQKKHQEEYDIAYAMNNKKGAQ